MKSSDAIQRHVNESSIQIMNQLNGNMEQVLRTIDYTLNYVINTNQLQEALYRPITYKDFQLYNQLKEELSLLQSPDTRVTDVIIANSASNWVINNRGLYPFDEYASNNHITTLIDQPGKSSYWTMLATGDFGSSDTQSYGCPHTLALVKKMPLHTSDKRGAAIATIPSCNLSAMIDKPNDSREVMVMDENYRIIVHNDRSKIGTLLTASGYVEESELTKFSGRAGQFQNEMTSITYVRSDFNGWTYASFTDLTEFNKEARSIGWFTFYVCLFIILIAVLLVWQGSRKVYSPIRSIFENVAGRLPDIRAQNKNELQVIDEHIRELFHSNANLRHEVNQNSRQVRTYFLLKMFQGQLQPAEIEEKIKLFGYEEQTSSWEHMAVLTLQIDILNDTRYEQKDLDLLLFAITNIIEDTVPPANRLHPVIIDQTQATLIGSGQMTIDEFHNYIYNLTEQIKESMKLYLQLDVSIGISLPFRNPRQTARAYREGLEALKHRLKLGKGVIIPYSSLNEGNHTRVYFYPSQLHNELIDAIKLTEETRARELLKEWLSEVLLKDRSPQEYQISLIRLLNDLMVVMQEGGVQLDKLNAREASLYEELMQLYVPSEIEDWFQRRIIGPLIAVFRDRQQSQYQNISEQIIEIIHREYDTAITLEECASRLHYNVFYLSSVFKKETDMTFSDYLSQYRLKLATKWLIETDMSVKDIAERLNFTNSQNFIRAFRKQEDITPGQYRSKYARPDA
ncbi:AraC family transcriptional regulator [Paenibacillus harenae]|uniref:AraC family transcriptional regulator n=1 Tax=Paenibacillus harenae TaxID=306543 RepID=UPI0027928AAB|nr:AraC family transcriptional regulator [Paenibacillus harenae]MDQ0061439.1 AraC-like DNA-binding protein [Paenibacillus harenae]